MRRKRIVTCTTMNVFWEVWPTVSVYQRRNVGVSSSANDYFKTRELSSTFQDPRQIYLMCWWVTASFLMMIFAVLDVSLAVNLCINYSFFTFIL